MRNLKRHPITPEEVAQSLRRMSDEEHGRGLVGNMRPLLLVAAAKTVEAFGLADGLRGTEGGTPEQNHKHWHEHYRGRVAELLNKRIALLERLYAAVWMVGNMDTPEDKAAWWATFKPLWDEVAAIGPDVQAWADREAREAHERRTGEAVPEPAPAGELEAIHKALLAAVDARMDATPGDPRRAAELAALADATGALERLLYPIGPEDGSGAPAGGCWGHPEELGPEEFRALQKRGKAEERGPFQGEPPAPA